MNKKLSYGIIILRYLLIPVLLLKRLGTMITLKYEVDKAYFTVCNHPTLTGEQGQDEYAKLDKERKHLNTTAALYVTGAIFSFCLATAMLVKTRKRSAVKQQST